LGSVGSVKNRLSCVFFTERAKAKGIDLGRLVNDLLKRDIELIEAVK